VCGNGECEQYETCSNCNADCGLCEPTGCFEIVLCAIGQCIDISGGFPPDFSLTCVANCVAQGCSDVQFFVDQFINCAIGALPNCGGGGDVFMCLQGECSSEFNACLNAECPPNP
jgi:hypothetical protein